MQFSLPLICLYDICFEGKASLLQINVACFLQMFHSWGRALHTYNHDLSLSTSATYTQCFYFIVMIICILAWSFYWPCRFGLLKHINWACDIHWFFRSLVASALKKATWFIMGNAVWITWFIGPNHWATSMNPLIDHEPFHFRIHWYWVNLGWAVQYLNLLPSIWICPNQHKTWQLVSEYLDICWASFWDGHIYPKKKQTDGPILVPQCLEPFSYPLVN